MPFSKLSTNSSASEESDRHDDESWCFGQRRLPLILRCDDIGVGSSKPWSVFEEPDRDGCGRNSGEMCALLDGSGSFHESLITAGPSSSEKS
jgi:hypothetical protein